MPPANRPGRRSTSDASYELVSHLASGGMAELFLARRTGDSASAPLVVLKRILPEHVRNREFVSMFLDEARLASRLNHPNIARVIEVGRIDDTYCYTMEYVRGKNAREILIKAASTRTRIPLEITVIIVAAAAAGLHAAHEQRDQRGQMLDIVHRDVSPSNVMIGYDGSVKIVDFGVAKAADRMTETRSGTIKGKTAYLSPEQCRMKAIDRRSDVFSLGIVAWEMLTQARLFRHDNDFDTMDAILRGAIAPPSELAENLPRGVDGVLLRALARDPIDRFSTAAEFATALITALGRPIPSNAPTRIAAFMHGLFGTVTDDPPADELSLRDLSLVSSLGSKRISVIAGDEVEASEVQEQPAALVAVAPAPVPRTLQPTIRQRRLTPAPAARSETPSPLAQIAASAWPIALPAPQRPTLPLGFTPKTSAPPPTAAPIADAAPVDAPLVVTPQPMVAESTLSSAAIWPMPTEPKAGPARRRGRGAAIAAALVVSAVLVVIIATNRSEPAAPSETTPVALAASIDAPLAIDAPPLVDAAVALAEPPTAVPDPQPPEIEIEPNRATADERRSPARPVETKPVAVPDETPPTPVEKAAAPSFVELARRASMRDNWSEALTQCKAGLQGSPGDAELNKLCAFASCMLGRRATAIAYAKKLPDAQRKRVEQSCKSKGKSITDCEDPSACR